MGAHNNMKRHAKNRRLHTPTQGVVRHDLKRGDGTKETNTLSAYELIWFGCLKKIAIKRYKK